MTPILEVWNFGDPKGSMVAFEALEQEAEAAGNEVYRAEVVTQIARCYGLQGQFDEAHASLDRAEKLPRADHPRVQTRIALERGRAFNSSGQRDKALPLFVQAWEVAQSAGEDYLAGDAVHMIAIVTPVEEAEDWVERGRVFVMNAGDTSSRHWLGPLHNNLGWSLVNAERYGDALSQFRLSQEAYEAEEDTLSVLIAGYSIGRTLRVMGNPEEAVQVLEETDAAFRARNETDGYVLEELALVYETLGRVDEARDSAGKAFEALSEDTWFVKNEAERLAYLEKLATRTE
jgi:tetratricopeptide (TPR) repeat protein